MKFEIAAVGKLRDKHCRALLRDYIGRIEHHVSCDHEPIRASRHGEVHAALAEEAARFEGRCGPRTVRVVLDERGVLESSAAWAARVEEWMVRGTHRVAFFLGSAHGVDEGLRERADLVWSLSPMTLPHELARVVLAEQLYRAMTIIRGEPYHK